MPMSLPREACHTCNGRNVRAGPGSRRRRVVLASRRRRAGAAPRANAIAVDLPAADESAGLAEYTDVVVGAIGGRSPIVLVAQSMGGFTAPLVCERVSVELLILANAMVPRPGETGNEWWTATGWKEEVGEVDMVEAFFHDVPADVKAAALAEEPPQSATPFDEPWPLTSWPDVPTRSRTAPLCGRDGDPLEWAVRCTPPAGQSSAGSFRSSTRRRAG